MRLVSVHPGVASPTWSPPRPFPGDRRRRSRDPATNDAELALLDELDPRGTRARGQELSPEPTNLSRPAQERAAGADAAPHPALVTPFCALVGVRYPIVQTGMGWVAGASLVSATAAAGGLGILASATMTLDELEHALAEVRSRTDAPFG